MFTLMLMLNSDALAIVPQQWAEATVINQLIRPIALNSDFAAPGVVLVTRFIVPLTPSAEQFANLFIREAEALYKKK